MKNGDIVNTPDGIGRIVVNGGDQILVSFGFSFPDVWMGVCEVSPITANGGDLRIGEYGVIRGEGVGRVIVVSGDVLSLRMRGDGRIVTATRDEVRPSTMGGAYSVADALAAVAPESPLSPPPSLRFTTAAMARYFGQGGE